MLLQYANHLLTLLLRYDLVAQVEKKTKTKTMPKMTRQRTKHVEHVTNLSPFDKNMIDKSEDLKGK